MAKRKTLSDEKILELIENSDVFASSVCYYIAMTGKVNEKDKNFFNSLMIFQKRVSKNAVFCKKMHRDLIHKIFSQSIKDESLDAGHINYVKVIKDAIAKC